jgi:DNA-binding NarL/FixJ family response regulator
VKASDGARPASVAIVEDEREVREGLRYLLGRDGRIRIAASFGSAEEFLSWIAENAEPDIVLMDIHLPGMSGIEATAALRERHPAVTVLILTIFEEEDKILDSIKAGAKGYILKNTRPEALLEQILSARAEGSPISPTVARRILEEIQRGAAHRDPGDYDLTPRELEVLRDIVDGLTYRELAERHHIAGSTAKKHILHIYQKLNVSSKAEIVRKAIEEKLV